MKGVIVQLFLLALIGTAFVAHPETIFSLLTTFFVGVLWFFLGVLLLAGGVFAYVRITGRTLASLGIRVVPDAGIKGTIWIGTKGQNVPLAITRKGGGVHVAWASQNYWVIMLAMTLFGPGMLASYLVEPHKFHLSMPFPMLVMFAAMWGGAWVVLAVTIVRFFFRRPEIILSASSLILRAGNVTQRTIWRQDVLGFSVRTTAYTTEHMTAVNYVLVAHLRDGEELGLCITDKSAQIGEITGILQEKGFALLEG